MKEDYEVPACDIIEFDAEQVICNSGDEANMESTHESFVEEEEDYQW